MHQEKEEGGETARRTVVTRNKNGEQSQEKDQNWRLEIWEVEIKQGNK